MGQSILVFISHSSDDKEGFIEPLVNDLEDCYINIWLDKRKIFPGDNLRKSIFRDGLDKADVALIFFTKIRFNHLGLIVKLSMYCVRRIKKEITLTLAKLYQYSIAKKHMQKLAKDIQN
ncbi:MAG: hypothetical protein ACI8WB_004620 [Phenylobacterium sp.]|jgi:hypothetical protein